MLDILKLFGAPGSIPLLVIATLAGLAVVRFSRGFRRAGWIGLGAVTIGYAVLALPVVANGIANALPPLDRAKDARDSISTLVVLDGDNRRGRVREVQRVLSTDSPTTVWVLGGRWILEALEDAGVSGPAFRYDALATTTREQMDQVARIVSAVPDGRTAVLTSRLQAPRVVALTRARGIHVTVLSSAVDAEPPTAGLGAYMPTYTALRVSRDAIYEHAALAYYRWRRWIR